MATVGLCAGTNISHCELKVTNYEELSLRSRDGGDFRQIFNASLVCGLAGALCSFYAKCLEGAAGIIVVALMSLYTGRARFEGFSQVEGYN